jgi:hypothetical protein
MQDTYAMQLINALREIANELRNISAYLARIAASRG